MLTVSLIDNDLVPETQLKDDMNDSSCRTDRWELNLDMKQWNPPLAFSGDHVCARFHLNPSRVTSWSPFHLDFNSMHQNHRPLKKCSISLRPCPHIPKQSFFPPSFTASFQEYLHPDGSSENDSKRCSSYSRLIGGTWNKKKQSWRDRACALSLHAVNKQTVDKETKHNKKKMKMACARKPESFVCTDNEFELLQLTLDYKASMLQETRTQAVVHHCCCCCCYETSQD